MLAVFASGLGLGAALGWQAACYLYRTEDKQKLVRARLMMYLSLYGGFGLAAILAVGHLVRK